MEKAKEKDFKKWAGIIIQVVIGMTIGILGSIYASEKIAGGGVLGILLMLIFIYIAIFLHINIHEFGHFVFGKTFGYKLISYRIWIFAWNYENGKMKFSIIKSNGYGGLCAMIPPEKELEVYKELLFYAGGILLNILSGILFIRVNYIFTGLSETIKFFFAIIGIVGIFLGSINLLSFFTGNIPTDGKIIWSKILKKPLADKMMIVTKLMAQLSAGIPPRDLVIDPDMELDKETFDLYIILYKYYKALDSNNVEEMNSNARILEKNIEFFPAHSLPSLYYELCYLACISGDEDKAKNYYEKAGKILERDKDVNGLRVKAYYEYYINKDLEAAATYCDNALAVVNKFPVKGQAFMEEDLVKALKEKIEN